MSEGNEGVNYLGMIRILRIPRLAGIFRVLKFLKNTEVFMWWLFQYSKGSIVMYFLRLLATTLCIVLVMACSCYYAMMMVVMGQDILPSLRLCFGNVSILVESLTSDSDTYHDKMEGMYESMQDEGLPHELQQRVHLYYTYLWQQYHTLDGKPAHFVSELSTNLQREIMICLNARMIRSVPMMQECNPEVVQEIVLSARRLCRVGRGNGHGNVWTARFFIQRGECEVIMAKE
ncbi:hypothetical protein H257_15881 [Aphanomyces astaci]|uniref:Cyclic nucleotide-binding domain-containing protein n=1 Tax=Aphanomyces astaci TaxID=112090 RepID=W4FMM6_APHAT|nr:hypothetical protein H257_15881 [Aphanomyces astaci]ETV68151.1 hypothetical protein H257_15881 [Aphanomyces astaci]|eukprot:XP_009842450.1 hypothetical protein H257_15881 [Aphanomyces astaci]